MLIELKPILDWLHANAHWAGVATFIVSLAESLAILGLFIPGSVVMTALGILVGTGVLPWLSMMIYAAGGAILGDVLSFWFGYHYRDNIHYIWPFHRYPNLLKRGNAFFQQYGGIGIFIGRFIGPLRPVLPLIAGMMSMRPARFLFADILSGIAWSPAYMLPGILIGAASQQLAPHTATRLILFALAILLMLGLISHLVKRGMQWIKSKIQRALKRFWFFLETYPTLRWFKQFIQNPQYPESTTQLGLCILFFLCTAAFIILAISVYQHGILTVFNVPLYHTMRAFRTTFVDQIMVGVTFVGEMKTLPLVWFTVLLWLILRRYWYAAVHWSGIGIAGFAGIVVIKSLIHSVRPSGILQSPPGWSFPSGHAILSVTLLGFLAILLTYGRNRLWRWFAFFFVSVSVLAICISRLYLGAHWLTDVIGGILFSLSCIILFTISYYRKPQSLIDPLGVLIVALTTLIISWGIHFYKNYTIALHNYTPVWPAYTIDVTHWWTQTDGYIPLYRVNRFDNPIQIMNLQWVGTLSNIQQTLSNQGWQKIKPSLVSAFHGLMSNDPAKQLPILSQLYEDRKPVLIMMKYNAQYKILLVLRLWDAHLKINTGKPLWLGTITFHQPWHTRFLGTNKNKISLPPKISPTDLLAQDLKKLLWKQFNYTNLENNHGDWDGKILLIYQP